MKLSKGTNQLVYWLVPLVAIVLALIQWLSNRSLGGDEAMLALNIITRSFGGLLAPLNDLQVAPILFLWLVKFCTVIIPDSELGLRLFPLISFVITAFFFTKISFKLFENQWVATAIISILLLNATILFYSSEVKQYMSDIMSSCVLIALLLKVDSVSFRKAKWLLGYGIIMVWLSNIAPFLLASAGFYLLVKFWPLSTRQIFPLAVVAFGWAFSFIVYYLLFINGHPAQQGMQDFWQDAGAFAPPQVFSIAFLRFVFFKFHAIFQKLSPFGLFGLYALWLFYCFGIIQLIRKKQWAMLALLLSPVLLHLLASLLKLYPFQSRLVFYLYPSILICCGFGALLLLSIFPMHIRKRLAAAGVIVPLAWLATIAKGQFPMRYEEIKESLQFVQAHAGQNDKVYIYYGAAMAYRYYKAAGKLPNHLTEVWGSSRSEPATYLNDLGQVSGRIWLLFSHVTDKENQAILQMLKEKGLQPAEVFSTTGSSAVLYQLP